MNNIQVGYSDWLDAVMKLAEEKNIATVYEDHEDLRPFYEAGSPPQETLQAYVALNNSRIISVE